MKTYNVTLIGTASYFTTVEAESEDEAMEMAYDEVPGLCHHCAVIDLDDFCDATVEAV